MGHHLKVMITKWAITHSLRGHYRGKWSLLAPLPPITSEVMVIGNHFQSDHYFHSKKVKSDGTYKCRKKGWSWSPGNQGNHYFLGNASRPPKFLHISKLRIDFLDVSKKSPERFQKASKRIPVDSLNSEKHSTYLQKCHRTHRSDSRAILGGAALSKSWVTNHSSWVTKIQWIFLNFKNTLETSILVVW